MTEREEILDAYIIRQSVAPAPLRTESENIPPEIKAMIEAAIEQDQQVKSGAAAKEGVWLSNN